MATKSVKARVVEENYLDGVLHHTKVHEKKTVYLRKGEWWVRYLTGYKRVELQPDGTYLWKFYVKTVKPISGAQLMHFLKTGEKPEGT